MWKLINWGFIRKIVFYSKPARNLIFHFLKYPFRVMKTFTKFYWWIFPKSHQFELSFNKWNKKTIKLITNCALSYQFTYLMLKLFLQFSIQLNLKRLKLFQRNEPKICKNWNCINILINTKIIGQKFKQKI